MCYTKYKRNSVELGGICRRDLLFSDGSTEQTMAEVLRTLFTGWECQYYSTQTAIETYGKREKQKYAGVCGK
jgi:hypothetical protein